MPATRHTAESVHAEVDALRTEYTERTTAIDEEILDVDTRLADRIDDLERDHSTLADRVDSIGDDHDERITTLESRVEPEEGSDALLVTIRQLSQRTDMHRDALAAITTRLDGDQLSPAARRQFQLIDERLLQLEQRAATPAAPPASADAVETIMRILGQYARPYDRAIPSTAARDIAYSIAAALEMPFAPRPTVQRFYLPSDDDEGYPADEEQPF